VDFRWAGAERVCVCAGVRNPDWYVFVGFHRQSDFDLLAGFHGEQEKDGAAGRRYGNGKTDAGESGQITNLCPGK
jgi:hypothetical protein